MWSSITSDDTVRPYAHPQLITLERETSQPTMRFVIDPWNQHWAIVHQGVDRVLAAADGRHSLPELIATARTCNLPGIDNDEAASRLINDLEYLGLLFSSEEEHRLSGQPVYNLVEFEELLGVHLEITNGCNLSCAHCYVSSGRRLPNELSFVELQRVIDLLPDGPRRVVISGGEPATRRDCIDIVRYAAERGHTVELYTNAYRLPSSFLPAVRDLRSEGGDVRLQVSLEGACATTHDSVRGPGTFVETLRGLEQIVDAGLHRSTTIFVCMTKANVHEVGDLIELAERLDVACLAFSQWQRQGNAAETPWASVAPDIEDWLRAGVDLLEYSGTRLEVVGNFFGDLRNSSAGRFTMKPSLFPKHLYFYNAFPRISPDGWVFADQFWTDPEWALGNVRENTLRECMTSTTLYRQLDALRARSDRIPECRSCEWRLLCESGSPGHAYAEYGRLDRRDLFCEARMAWFERYAEQRLSEVAGFAQPMLTE